MSITTARLTQTATELETGRLAPAELVDRLCDRIDTVDSDVRAMVEEPGRRERLHDEVTALTDRYPEGADRPSLYGIPVGVKDIVHVDGLPTRAGSAVPPDVIAGSEATVVERLRSAGCVVLGKTVTTEFAGFAPGPTRNPHDLEHTPGGSSSGSAAAVAAGMTPLAVGTQTGGSVIRPAAYCGVVGFKPTYGRVPRDGVIPRSTSIDHVGLFTQDVEGMALAAAAVCDSWGPTTEADRPTLGVPDGPYLEAASTDALDAFEAQLSSLSAAGYDVVRVRTFEDVDRVNDRLSTLSRAEVAIVHHEWYDDYAPFYRTPLAERIEAGRQVTIESLADARAGRESTRTRLHETMTEHGVDLWVSPSTPGPAPEGITHIGPSDMNRVWTYTGVPTVSVPAGTIEGLPIGLQIAARFGADERLLAWADPIASVLES